MNFFKRSALNVGLDITDEVIQVAVLKRSLPGYSLDRRAMIPTPAGSIVNGMVNSPEKVARALKELWSKNQVGPKRVSIAIRGEGIMLRVEVVPYAREDKVEELLRAKLNQYVVFTGAEVVLGWETMEEIAVEGKRWLRVLVAAAKSDMVRSYIEALRRAGLAISAITFPSLAIASALRDGSLKGRISESKVLVAVDEKSTFVHLLQGEKVSLVHTIDIGSDGFMRDESAFNALVDEVNKIIGARKEAARIIFGGGKAGLEEMINREKGRFSRPVEMGWGTLKPSPELFPAMAAVGLARQEPFQINLLPVDEVTAEEWRKSVAYLLYALSGFSLFMLLTFFALNLGSVVLNAQIATVKNELGKPSFQFTQLREIEEKTKKIKELISGRRETMKNYKGLGWDVLLREISGLIPESARLLEIDHRSGNAVSLRGEAMSSGGVFEFIRNLRTSEYFGAVELRLMRLEGKQNNDLIGFNIMAEKRSSEK